MHSINGHHEIGYFQVIAITRWDAWQGRRIRLRHHDVSRRTIRDEVVDVIGYYESPRWGTVMDCETRDRGPIRLGVAFSEIVSISPA